MNRLGWSTSVLTVKNRKYYVYDYTLLEELEGKSVIHRTFSLDPSYLFGLFTDFLKKEKTISETSKKDINEEGFLIKAYRLVRDWILLPDGYGGWIPFGVFKGFKVIKKEKPDVLLCTFPYVSNAFVTYLLHLTTKVPYVIDFRDGWLDDPYFVYPSGLHRRFHAYFEKRVLINAENIVVFGDIQKQFFEKRYSKLKGRIFEINNGYDPEDLSSLTSHSSPSSKLRLVYSGAVYMDRKETFINFIKALTLIEYEKIKNLEVIFVGDKQDWSEDFVIKNNLQNIVFFTGYLPHREALNVLALANCSLMFLRKGDFVALTGKVFEYIGLSKINFVLALLLIIFLETIQYIQTRINITEYLLQKPKSLRWSVYYFFVLFIIVFGIFNQTSFIYFQF